MQKPPLKQARVLTGILKDGRWFQWGAENMMVCVLFRSNFGTDSNIGNSIPSFIDNKIEDQRN